MNFKLLLYNLDLFGVATSNGQFSNKTFSQFFLESIDIEPILPEVSQLPQTWLMGKYIGNLNSFDL
jgi:hypothetical protein